MQVTRLKIRDVKYELEERRLFPNAASSRIENKQQDSS